MKELILLITLAIGMIGCSRDYGNNIDSNNTSKASNLSVVIIDSCEYLQFASYGYYSITHKGNCKNTIHTKIGNR